MPGIIVQRRGRHILDPITQTPIIPEDLSHLSPRALGRLKFKERQAEERFKADDGKLRARELSFRNSKHGKQRGVGTHRREARHATENVKYGLEVDSGILGVKSVLPTPWVDWVCSAGCECRTWPEHVHPGPVKELDLAEIAQVKSRPRKARKGKVTPTIKASYGSPRVAGIPTLHGSLISELLLDGEEEEEDEEWEEAAPSEFSFAMFSMTAGDPGEQDIDDDVGYDWEDFEGDDDDGRF